MAIRDEFPRLSAAAFDEIVTHSHVRDIALRSGRTMALITLDNGRDHTRPSTLGPATLFERTVGLYGSLINVNAYHQPGVEAGKAMWPASL